MIGSILALFLCIVSPVRAGSPTDSTVAPESSVLVVDRRAQSITLYLSTPTSDLETIFGSGAGDLLGRDGTVDIEGLYEGTFELADRIFASVKAKIGDVPVAFEATSMMVHDPEALPVFASPWDGETAIAVCTSPETVDQLGLDTLQAYMGFFAWQVNGIEMVSLTFPETGRAPVEVEVREFWNLQFTGARKEILADGGTLRLEAGQGVSLAPATLWLLALACLGVGLVSVLASLRDRRRGAIADSS